MDYTTKSCREFVTVLASNEPAPGGGGASALVAALGTALPDDPALGKNRQDRVSGACNAAWNGRACRRRMSAAAKGPAEIGGVVIFRCAERNFAAAIFDLADHDADLHALNGAREA